MKLDKPVIHYRSRGESGNVFWLLGAVSMALKKRRRITEYNDMRDRVLSSGSYPEALAIMKEYVTLVDDDAG